jgi:tripartite-type tricarboxylate transporter receptor subunit TctC
MRKPGALLLAAVLALAGNVAWGQGAFPTRPVRVVVGFPPGGGTDIVARLVAQKLGERWGQPVVVENRPGASGNIGAELVARSAPDGYSLLMAFSSHASNPALSKLPFDINRDFTSITQVGSAPMTIVAHPSLPAKTLGELIDYARANPGAIKFGSSGVGTPVHLAGELMMQLTGTRMVHVPYKGIASAMAAVLGGEISRAGGSSRSPSRAAPAIRRCPTCPPPRRRACPVSRSTSGTRCSVLAACRRRSPSASSATRRRCSIPRT